MDIVTRIKKFLNLMGIPNSQFADTCDIPRPTVSQLLNGRNKKVSDEIISKIHAAYPSLSVMWLLFGEEPMMLDGAAQSSSSDTVGGGEVNLFDENLINVPNDRDMEINSNLSELTNQGRIVFDESKPYKSAVNNDTDLQKQNIAQTIEKITHSAEFKKSNGERSNMSSKEIVNIMVFYSDNSFESFKPADK